MESLGSKDFTGCEKGTPNLWRGCGIKLESLGSKCFINTPWGELDRTRSALRLRVSPLDHLGSKEARSFSGMETTLPLGEKPVSKLFGSLGSPVGRWCQFRHGAKKNHQVIPGSLHELDGGLWR